MLLVVSYLIFQQGHLPYTHFNDNVRTNQGLPVGNPPPVISSNPLIPVGVLLKLPFTLLLIFNDMQNELLDWKFTEKAAI